MEQARSERMPAGGRGRALPLLLLVLLIASLVLAPVIAVFLAVAVAIHAHLGDVPWLRNVAIAVFVLSVVIVLLGGTGGSVSGGLVG
jgi:hypothetical protein